MAQASLIEIDTNSDNKEKKQEEKPNQTDSKKPPTELEEKPNREQPSSPPVPVNAPAGKKKKKPIPNQKNQEMAMRHSLRMKALAAKDAERKAQNAEKQLIKEQKAAETLRIKEEKAAEKMRMKEEKLAEKLLIKEQKAAAKKQQAYERKQQKQEKAKRLQAEKERQAVAEQQHEHGVDSSTLLSSLASPSSQSSHASHPSAHSSPLLISGRTTSSLLSLFQQFKRALVAEEGGLPDGIITAEWELIVAQCHGNPTPADIAAKFPSRKRSRLTPTVAPVAERVAVNEQASRTKRARISPPLADLGEAQHPVADLSDHDSSVPNPLLSDFSVIPTPIAHRRPAPRTFNEELMRAQAEVRKQRILASYLLAQALID